MIFCTCFDKGYLDKGLVLYRSLSKCCPEFHLYIACFDTTVYKVLSDCHLSDVTLLDWQQYETEAFLEKKRERTRAEYYWTCTTHIIELVLDQYQEEHCIYIDADMAFFSDPTVLLAEIRQAGSHIGIMEHRFNDNWMGHRYLRRSGRYCVEFNYFDQTEESRRALTWWKERCWEWCYQIYEPERMGDQKYLEQFPALFQGVYVFENPGAGVAPWNLAQYRLADQVSRANAIAEKRITLLYQKKTKTPLIFYHFQNICYVSDKYVNIGTGVRDKALKKAIYYPYLAEIENVRKELEQYGVGFSETKVASSHAVMRIWEKYFMKFKMKSASDFIRLEDVRNEVCSDNSARALEI